LESYVNELETELDEEIAALDSDHDTTREQVSADNDNMPNDYSDDESHDEEDDATPLSRLRCNRPPSYGHLKGQAGDGSLPTIARPDEFKGGRHQSHIILQSVILTQYNLKQDIKKFGDQGKAAVLTELRQLYDRDVMDPVNKYNLTPVERKCRWTPTMQFHVQEGDIITNCGNRSTNLDVHRQRHLRMRRGYLQHHRRIHAIRHERKSRHEARGCHGRGYPKD
jgi:hypothetical protein